MKPVNFIFFDIFPPKSFDPLDADSGFNLNTMRMLYLTPLEISLENKLISTVLESFKYDRENKEIIFVVRTDLKYSDGSSITTNDIVLAITRMMLARPKFPILRDIIGLDEWLKLNEPLKNLPKGIIVDNQTIKIRFSRSHLSPLFRFTLELFSIIPSRCVDFKTNKMTCERAPYSGYYTLNNFNSDLLQFQKRNEYRNLSYPSNINFIYNSVTSKTFKDYLIRNDTVLYGMDLRLKDGTLSEIPESMHFEWLPAARFVYLSINPNFKPFDDILCRHVFMEVYRDTAKDIFQNHLTLSSSIFTPLMPGYLKDSELFQPLTISEKQRNSCLNRISQAKIPWHISDTNKLAMSEKILFETMKKIDPISKPFITPFSERDFQFDTGKIPFSAGSSGFWAEDPTGDLQMFFTPGLHNSIKYAIQDTVLQKQLLALDESSLSLSSDLKKINLTIYQEAYMNIFMHTRRFFASRNKNIIESLPQAVSSPPFYQVIKSTELND